MCEVKGIRLTEDGYEKIYALAEGFSGEGSGGGSGGSPNGEDSGGGKDPAFGETRGENGKSPASAQDSAFPPSEPSSQDSSSETLLQLFNHIAPRSENWVIYPYRCSVDTETYAGSLKALYTSAGKAQNYVLSVRSRRRQDEVWRFTWKNRGKLKVYYTGNLSTANELFPKWARKFRKLGLFSDDTIYNGEFFDGFGDFPDEENSVNEMA
jgi:hypothetical protein